MPDREIRIVSYPIQYEVREEGSEPKIIGYAALFDNETEIFPGFNEKVAAGAFSETIINDDVRALFNHDPNLVLGRNIPGTLRLSEDKTGLRYEITPPDTQFAKDLVALIRRGDISQSSFAFQVIEHKFIRGEDGKPDLRVLEKVRLFDVSAVTYPAYTDTTVAVRSHGDWIKSKAEPLVYKRGIWRQRLNLYQYKGGTRC